MSPVSDRDPALPWEPAAGRPWAPAPPGGPVAPLFADASPFTPEGRRRLADTAAWLATVCSFAPFGGCSTPPRAVATFAMPAGAAPHEGAVVYQLCESCLRFVRGQQLRAEAERRRRAVAEAGDEAAAAAIRGEAPPFPDARTPALGGEAAPVEADLVPDAAAGAPGGKSPPADEPPAERAPRAPRGVLVGGEVLTLPPGQSLAGLRDLCRRSAELYAEGNSYRTVARIIGRSTPVTDKTVKKWVGAGQRLPAKGAIGRSPTGAASPPKAGPDGASAAASAEVPPVAFPDAEAQRLQECGRSAAEDCGD
jgi:hypothetical protein